MPQGWDFGALGYTGGKQTEQGHVAYRIDGDKERNRMQVKNVHPKV